MSNNKSMEVVIGGHTLNIRYENDENTVMEIVDHVRNHLKSMGHESGEISAKAALLCALNITEEYFNSRNETTEVLNQLEMRTKKIQEHLESLGN
ncbi:MAG: cell division protein ZapA [Deltaproteobacteria bacterium]|nr:cell division protein ZapA [Deltaproteobacteria bacterium]